LAAGRTARDLVAHSLLRPHERTKIVAGRHQTLPMTTSSSLGGRFGLERSTSDRPKETVIIRPERLSDLS
jgi:hypothetical protein